MPKIETRTTEVFGHCQTAALVEAGTISSTTDAAGWHALCRHVAASGAKVTVCGCSCHDGIDTCVDCGTTEHQLIDHRCLDREACAERLHDRIQNSEGMARLRAIREKAAVEAEPAREEKRAKRAASVKAGRCHHCGGATSGGMFLPGHDMKLKGMLVREAEAGSAEAVAEARARNWYKEGRFPALEAEAEVILQTTPTHTFLRDRNEARWAEETAKS